MQLEVEIDEVDPSCRGGRERWRWVFCFRTLTSTTAAIPRLPAGKRPGCGSELAFPKIGLSHGRTQQQSYTSTSAHPSHSRLHVLVHAS